MSSKRALLGVVACFALIACGGAPSQGDIQSAVERLAEQEPILFGSDKPVIKEANCTKIGDGRYDCVTSLAVSSAPDDAHPVTVKMTKLGGEWTAQIPNIMQ